MESDDSYDKLLRRCDTIGIKDTRRPPSCLDDNSIMKLAARLREGQEAFGYLQQQYSRHTTPSPTPVLCPSPAMVRHKDEVSLTAQEARFLITKLRTTEEEHAASQQECRALQQEVNTLRSKVSDYAVLQTDLKIRDSQLAACTEKQNALKTQYGRLQEMIEDTTKGMERERERLSIRLSESEEEVRQLKEELGSTQAALEQAKHDEAALQERLVKQATEMGTLRADLAEANKKYNKGVAEWRERMSEAEDECRRLEASFSVAHRNASTEQERLQRRVTELGGRLEEAEKKADETARSNTGLRIALDGMISQKGPARHALQERSPNVAQHTASTKSVVPRDEPFLGVALEGCTVTSVKVGGPAYRAGIKQQDTITHLSSTPVTTPQEIAAVLTGFVPGDTISIRVTDGQGNVRTDLSKGLVISKRPKHYWTESACAL